MKRSFVAVLLFAMATAAFAGDAHRYVVQVRNVPRIAPRVQTVDGVVDFASRDFVGFSNLDGYAVSLTDEEAAALRKEPGVRSVQPVSSYRLLDVAHPAAGKASVLARDPNAQTQAYGIGLVNAPQVWPVTRGENVNVAVVDTGIDYRHPDLKPVYAGGFNAITGSNDPLDDGSASGHGTHVAGIIGAADNNLGVVGVAPGTHIWGVKVFKNSGKTTTDFIAAGLDWVIAQKQKIGGNWIVNMSLGQSVGDPPDPFFRDACQRVADAGVLIIVAAGNDGANQLPEPANYPSVVAVGAVDSNSQIADFSDQGPELALTAPGVDVLSTFPIGTGTLTSITAAGSLLDASVVDGSKQGTLTAGWVNCGLGQVQDFPPDVAGKIAVIQRGGTTFNEKAKNAVAAGAIGVVIYNNDSPFGGWTLIGTLPDGVTKNPADLAFNWPVVVGVTKDIGQQILSNKTATLTLYNQPDDYASESGTSMSSPHAVGVAALVWSAAPDASAADVKHALFVGAHDLGSPGQDVTFGYGLVDALASAKSIAPSKFGNGVTPPPPPVVPSGRRSLKRH